MVNLWNPNTEKKYKITFSEHLFLISVYFGRTWGNITFSDQLQQKMIDEGFIIKTDTFYELTDKGNEIFEPDAGLFEEFLHIFPTRVNDVDGKPRILSPASVNTNAGHRLHTKWYQITKSDKKKERHIIECLKAEVKLREQTGKLYYMRAIETWLQKSTWEDYEYLLVEDKSKNITTTNRDLRL